MKGVIAQYDDAISRIAKRIMRKLSRYEPHVFHRAGRTGSMYIKFRNGELGAIRVSDHGGKRYAYPWRVRTDVPRLHFIDGVFHGKAFKEYGVGKLSKLVKDFEGEYNK